MPCIISGRGLVKASLSSERTVKAEEFSILDAITEWKLKKKIKITIILGLWRISTLLNGAHGLFYLGKSFFTASTCIGLKSGTFSITKKQVKGNFHIPREGWWLWLMKLKRAILNFSVHFHGLNSYFRGMFRKQKCSLGSYLIVGKEKSKKSLRKISRIFLKILAKLSSLTLSARSGRGVRSLFIPYHYLLIAYTKFSDIWVFSNILKFNNCTLHLSSLQMSTTFFK